MNQEVFEEAIPYESESRSRNYSQRAQHTYQIEKERTIKSNLPIALQGKEDRGKTDRERSRKVIKRKIRKWEKRSSNRKTDYKIVKSDWMKIVDLLQEPMEETEVSIQHQNAEYSIMPTIKYPFESKPFRNLR